MFQDGIIAQAIDAVSRMGVAYFSAAGNAARHAYESVYAPATTFAADSFPVAAGVPAFFGGVAHDFGGGDLFQKITVAEGRRFTLSFQWDSPSYSVSGGTGSANDLDVYVFDDPPTTVLAAGSDPNIGSDPVEILQFTNPLGSGRGHPQHSHRQVRRSRPGSRQVRSLRCEHGRKDRGARHGERHDLRPCRRPWCDRSRRRFLRRNTRLRCEPAASRAVLLRGTGTDPVHQHRVAEVRDPRQARDHGAGRRRYHLLLPRRRRGAQPFAELLRYFGCRAARGRGGRASAAVRAQPVAGFGVRRARVDRGRHAGTRTRLRHRIGPRPSRGSLLAALHCHGQRATIVGSAGRDNIVGTSGDDVIVTLCGNDRVRGGDGADIICGGPGDDRLLGKGGNDVLDGGEGDDVLRGGDGDDESTARGDTRARRRTRTTSFSGYGRRSTCKTGESLPELLSEAVLSEPYWRLWVGALPDNASR